MNRLARMGAVALACGLLWSGASAQGTTPTIGKVPDGFTPLLGSSSTRGWHWSRSVHHGTTARASVKGGELVLEPFPFGQGGLLLTDKSYRDFDLYLEARPDPDYNSGIFLRSTETGSAYQVELVRPGNTGDFLGEGLTLTRPKYLDVGPDIDSVWRDGEWNSMRVRMEGENPHVTLWINGVKMWEVQMPRNDQIAGRYGGMIGLQLHWTATYSDAAQGTTGGGRSGLVQRFRNIAIRELRR